MAELEERTKTRFYSVGVTQPSRVQAMSFVDPSEGGGVTSTQKLGLNMYTVRTIEHRALRKLRKQTRQLREIQGLLAEARGPLVQSLLDRPVRLAGDRKYTFTYCLSRSTASPRLEFPSRKSIALTSSE